MVTDAALIAYWKSTLKLLEARRGSGRDRKTVFYCGSIRNAIDILSNANSQDQSDYATGVMAVMRKRLADSIPSAELARLEARGKNHVAMAKSGDWLGEQGVHGRVVDGASTTSADAELSERASAAATAKVRDNRAAANHPAAEVGGGAQKDRRRDYASELNFF